ncbi:hypothetical protein M3172_04200 [Mesobacillus subterraneus]|uniref:hypothetical protein n=1 Tax=Mesobacillus subterraneus TaxID=285983 RepID=UPI0020415215|nr:hypothetical protein [Mesobacillus subterraneus]MCM3572377.1 hypothetical protein [Mesobacillus subterraneus]
MMKKSAIILFGIIMFLASCSSEDKSFNDNENSREKERINLEKAVNMITVTANGLGFFTETEGQNKEGKVVFEQTEEIEVILKAIKDASSHTGPMTDEGENFKMILSYKDGTSDTILLWLYPDRNSGRIQRKNYTGPIYLLSKEDVQSIVKLIDKKSSQ